MPKDRPKSEKLLKMLQQIAFWAKKKPNPNQNLVDKIITHFPMPMIGGDIFRYDVHMA